MVRTLLLLSSAIVCWGQPSTLTYPHQTESDFVTHNFPFKSGDKLADLKIHYITLGTPSATPPAMFAMP
jgi:homoserine O-acetyltransferase